MKKRLIGSILIGFIIVISIYVYDLYFKSYTVDINIYDNEKVMNFTMQDNLQEFVLTEVDKLKESYLNEENYQIVVKFNGDRVYVDQKNSINPSIYLSFENIEKYSIKDIDSITIDLYEYVEKEYVTDILYKTTREETETLAKGKEEIKVKGIPGKETVTGVETYINGVWEDYDFKTVIEDPTNEVVLVGTYVAPQPVYNRPSSNTGNRGNTNTSKPPTTTNPPTTGGQLGMFPNFASCKSHGLSKVAQNNNSGRFWCYEAGDGSYHFDWWDM